MTNERCCGLKGRLVLLVLVAVAPGLLWVGYSGIRDRQATKARFLRTTSESAAGVSRHQAHVLNSTRQLLSVLGRMPEVRGREAEFCTDLFRHFLEGMPVYLNLGASDEAGWVWCSALPVEEAVAISGRDYFQQAMRTGEFSVGTHQIGLITGKPSVNCGFPIRSSPDEAPSGVVFAALDLEHLAEIALASVPWNSLPGTELTLLDNQGTVLVHLPPSDAARTDLAPISREHLLECLVESADASVCERTVSQERWILAHAPVGVPESEKGLYVALAVPRSALLAESNLHLTRSLIGVGIWSLMVLVVALWGGEAVLFRWMRRLQATTGRLGEGKLSSRVPVVEGGPPELRRLAESFNQMADTLETRIRELDSTRLRLEVSEAESKALLGAMSDLVIVVDFAGRYIKMPATQHKFRLKPTEQLVGRRFHDLFPRPVADDLLAVVRRVLDTRESEFHDYDLTLAGKTVSFSACVSFLTPLTVLWVARDISSRKEAEVRIVRQIGQLGALRAIDTAITASLDLHVTLHVILEQVVGQLNVDAADILLCDPHAHMLEYAQGRGFHTDALRHTRLQLGEGIAGRAALERRLVKIPNLREQNEILVRSPLMTQEGFVSFYAMPLITKGEVKGVLELFHREVLAESPEWLAFLEALASQAAIAIDNSTLFNGLQKSKLELVVAYDRTLEGWARALEFRDIETYDHTLRVTETTLRMARLLDVPEEKLVHIRRGGILHDIGKIGVPDDILFKPGPLDEEQWAVMHKHPEYARQLLQPIAYLRPALAIPYGHHEKYDGTGYPQGLAKEAIPLEARLFAVADIADALQSDRPYRKAWPREKVLVHLESLRGTHLCPVALDAFQRLNGNAPPRDAAGN